jgi:hypothetical protein
VTCPHGGMVQHLLPCMVKCSPLCTQTLLCQVNHLLCCCVGRICPLKPHCSLLSLLQGLRSHETVSHRAHFQSKLCIIQCDIPTYVQTSCLVSSRQSWTQVAFKWHCGSAVNKTRSLTERRVTSLCT